MSLLVLQVLLRFGLNWRVDMRKLVQDQSGTGGSLDSTMAIIQYTRSINLVEVALFRSL